MTQVIVSNRAVGILTPAVSDLSSTLLKMMTAGIITQYYIVAGEKIAEVIGRVPQDEPLVIVVGDSAAVEVLEKEISPLRSSTKTDIIRVRPEGSLEASGSLKLMPGHIVMPSEFWNIFESVIGKYSTHPASESAQPASLSAKDAAQQHQSDGSYREQGEQEETLASLQKDAPSVSSPVSSTTSQASSSGGASGALPIGVWGRLFGGRKRPSDLQSGREEEGEYEKTKERKSKDVESERQQERGRTAVLPSTPKMRIVPVRCSRIGISGATADEFDRISSMVDRIYQQTVSVARVPLSAISVSTIPVVVVVNGRNIDDPQLARAAIIVVLEEDTKPEQLSSLPNIDIVVTSRRKLIDKVVNVVCEFVEGKRCAL